MIRALILAVLLVPQLAAAQTILEFFTGIVLFINLVIIPFVMAIAVLFFVINVVRYFIVGAADSEKRAIAKQYILYSLLGFIIIVGFWRILDYVVEAAKVPRDCRTVDQYFQKDYTCS